MTRRPSKYRNTRTNGFASKKEAARYEVLRLLEAAGQIHDLKTQVRLAIVIAGVKVCTYIADFSYRNEVGFLVHEDVKGYRTDIYRLKKKLVKAVLGIEILET